MTGTFGDMVARIASDLVRSNLTTQIKNSINDAIEEAAKTRFFFNEMRAVTFPTVAAQEYYDDQGLVGIDAVYYFQGSVRYALRPWSNIAADMEAEGNAINSGQLDMYARHDTSLRLWPIPTGVVTIYLDGYGKLTPTPLTEDTDTNNWMTYGERYIRALAKSIMYKDVIRDPGQAALFESIADDFKSSLENETAERLGTGVVTPTQF